MSSHPVVRFATPGDTPRVVAMLRKSLGPGMSEELWRWKHLESPFGPSPVLVAEAGTELVAVRAFMRWEWTSDGLTVPAVRAVDTATHPDWRRRGLFADLTERLVEHCTEEGVHFVFNTPNQFSRPGYLKLGWSRVVKIPLRVRPKLGRMLLRAVQPARGPSGEEPYAPGVFHPVGELLARPGIEPLLVDRTRNDGRYRTPRTLEYLTWRYRDAPSRAYRASWTFRGDGGAAVIFHTRLRKRLRVVMISEVLATNRGSARRDGARLLRDVVNRSGADAALAVGGGGSLASQALAAAGFLPIPGAGPQLTARPLAWSGDGPDPRSWRSWSCSLGDLEVF